MPRYLLAGPVLLGFASLFDAAWGKPCAGPTPVIAPTCIGGVPQDFPCPHCGAVRPVLTDRRMYESHRDPWRGFSWCPACRGRYRLTEGASLPAPLVPGAAAVPTRALIGGKACILGLAGVVRGGDLDLLDAQGGSR